MKMMILIVEDEPPMVELLERFLKSVSSQIDSTDNLESALAMAHNHPYNICILDLKLKTTGKEDAFRAIHKFKELNCSVVVVSGLTDPKLKEDALAAGADVVVPKDGSFGERSMLLAAYIATLKLPRESYRSDSYLRHVDMLKAMVQAA